MTDLPPTSLNPRFRTSYVDSVPIGGPPKGLQIALVVRVLEVRIDHLIIVHSWRIAGRVP